MIPDHCSIEINNESVNDMSLVVYISGYENDDFIEINNKYYDQIVIFGKYKLKTNIFYSMWQLLTWRMYSTNNYRRVINTIR